MIFNEEVASKTSRPAGAPVWLSLARAGRRRMLRTFPFSSLRAHGYHKRLTAFSKEHEGIAHDEICRAFDDVGGLMLSKEDTARLFGAGLLPLCENARAVLAASPHPILENEAALTQCPDFYRLGLSPAVLDLAEACLGLDCLYLGATLKCEKADGRIAGTRQWHLDIEDEKLFRILLYLAPVTPDCGPFEFFPREVSRALKAGLHYRSGYVEDTRIALVAPMQLWEQCTGDTGEAVIFDGAGVFHRGKIPLAQDRYSITFAYCSRRPLELRRSACLPVPRRRAFLATLSTRQRQAIPLPYLF